MTQKCAEAIGAALRRELGGSRRAIKTAVRWTGASERTVKNWFAGTHSPSGDNLVTLARQCPAVMSAFHELAGWSEELDPLDKTKLRNKLMEAISIVDG